MSDLNQGETAQMKRPLVAIVRIFAWAGWWFLALSSVAFFAVMILYGDANCDLRDGLSTYGDQEVTVWPPFGLKCTWIESLHGVDRVSGPSWVFSVVFGCLVLSACAIWLLPRFSNRAEDVTNTARWAENDR